MLKNKDIVSLKELSEQEILDILETAETMTKINTTKKTVPYLQGKTIMLIFKDSEIKKRISTELACKYLGANVIILSWDKIESFYKNVLDLGTLIEEQNVDFLIMTNKSSGAAKFLSSRISASIINEGDGLNESPIKALADLMVISKRKGRFKDLNVVFIGDMINNRIGKSLMWGLLKLGANVKVSGPPTLIPTDLEKEDISVFYDPFDAVVDADVVINLRVVGHEDKYGLIPSLDEYKSLYKISEQMLKLANEDVVIINAGTESIRRGIEISTKVLDKELVVQDDELSSGIAIRMAILFLLSAGGSKKDEKNNN